MLILEINKRKGGSMQILINKQTESKLSFNNITPELLCEARLFFDFTKTLKNCAGLAYNQVGGEKRFCAIFGKERIFMLNLQIIKYTGKIYKTIEHCLSFPNKDILATRNDKVLVTFYNFLKRKSEVRTYGGYTAQIIQHENEHLDGIIHKFK